MLRSFSGRRFAVLTVALVTAALATLIGIAASVATAAFPGENGKIVFQTNRDGNAEIYTMNADGTNRVNLTRHQGEDVDPHWSADGLRIVFASNRDGNYEIFTMNGDGSGVTQLTSTSVNNRWPSWTNDDQILFHRGTFPGRDVYRMNPDGTGLTNLTPEPSDSAWASAAPRGPMIAFSRFSDAEGQRLYNLNTISGVTKLVTPASPAVADVQANWSPNGNDLVFVRFSDTGSELFVVHKDGSDLTQVTNTPTRTEFQPGFSPDGRKIVFHACSDIGTASQHCANYVMNHDGTGEGEVSLRPQAPYLDTFTGDWLDPFWSLTMTGTGPALIQTNGRFEITVPAETTNDPVLGYVSAGPFMQCRLPDDFDMQVDYQLLSWPATSGVNVNFDGIEFVGGAFSGVHGMFVFDPGSGTGVSTHFPGANVFVPDPSLSGSLRLRRSGGSVTAYRLSNGSWEELLTSPDYTADESAAHLSIFSNVPPNSHPEVKVAFDNFRISSGTIGCPSWWDDSAPDWQAITK